MINRAGISLVALAVLAAFAGCGEDVPEGQHSEKEQVAKLVRAVADASRTEPSFKALFASGASPQGRANREYAKYTFRPIEEPEVDGESATIAVLVRDVRDQEIGNVEWTAVKENGEWKLSSAPLPGS
jgi:hypothetical protein